MNEVTGHLNAQHARLVELTVALLANEHRWVESGVHTPELFLAWRAGLSAQHARQVVAIARRIDELPVSSPAVSCRSIRWRRSPIGRRGGPTPKCANWPRI